MVGACILFNYVIIIVLIISLHFGVPDVGHWLNNVLPPRQESTKAYRINILPGWDVHKPHKKKQSKTIDFSRGGVFRQYASCLPDYHNQHQPAISGLVMAIDQVPR